MKTTDQNFIEMCAKVADLTDNNAHTEVKQVIAKFFGYTHYINVFNAIAAIFLKLYYKLIYYICNYFFSTLFSKEQQMIIQ